MNDVLEKIFSYIQRKTNLKAVVVVAFCVFFLGLFFSFVIFIFTFKGEQLWNLDFCLTSKCVDYWAEVNASALNVLSIAGGAIIGVVTIGGIVVALLSYRNSVNYSSVSNHLSHLNLFISYVSSETGRRSLLSRSSIESLKWYNLIYPYSATGSFEVSQEYVCFILNLNNLVNGSNAKYATPDPDPSQGYRYKEHQKEMIFLLKNIGVYLESLPRIDFNEVETQVFDLIETVNMSFCRSKMIPGVIERSYH
jgi:hypothetical protein